MEEFNRYGGVIVKHKDEVLLCKRGPKESLPNQWSIPCGHLEKDEDPKEGALREFVEETDIKLPKDISLVGLLNMYRKDMKRKKGVMFVFTHDSNKKLIPDLDNAKDGFEHTECGYFNRKNLPIPDKNDQLRKIIEKII